MYIFSVIVLYITSGSKILSAKTDAFMTRGLNGAGAQKPFVKASISEYTLLLLLRHSRATSITYYFVPSFLSYVLTIPREFER